MLSDKFKIKIWLKTVRHFLITIFTLWTLDYTFSLKIGFALFEALPFLFFLRDKAACVPRLALAQN